MLINPGFLLEAAGKETGTLTVTGRPGGTGLALELWLSYLPSASLEGHTGDRDQTLGQRKAGEVLSHPMQAPFLPRTMCRTPNDPITHFRGCTCFPLSSFQNYFPQLSRT